MCIYTYMRHAGMGKAWGKCEKRGTKKQRQARQKGLLKAHKRKRHVYKADAHTVT